MTRKLLTVTLLTVLSLELCLRVFDPLGIVRHLDDITTINAHTVPALDVAYTMTAGTFGGHGWTATVTSEGTRFVSPDNAAADCVIAFVGDSFMFGWGVNDAETIPSLFARQNRDVRWVNGAVSGYSTRNVYNRIQSLPADGYIWLTIGNDLDGIAVYQGALSGVGVRVAMVDYWKALHRESSAGELRAGIAEHERYTELIQAYPVLIFAYEDMPAAYRPNDAILIAAVDDRISWSDRHPNAAGYRDIYSQMSSSVSEFVTRICSESRD